MSASDERPLSVAELLARNGTIGSPPVGGRRRRSRRNSDGVSVAELTGEIPVIRTGEIPVVGAEESDAVAASEEDGDTVYEEEAGEEAVYEEVVYEEAVGEESVPEEVVGEEVVGEEVVGEEVVGEEAVYEEAVLEEAVLEEAVYEEAVNSEEFVAESSETVVVYASTEVPEYTGEYAAEETAAVEVGNVAVDEVEAEAPPLADDPRPHRNVGPELSHDPRPLRRSSGAEQMAYDPVDESVNLDDLVEEHVEDVEQLRSYLRGSQDTLFSGGTVADDLARGGADLDSQDYEADLAVGPAVRPRQVGSTLWNSVLAVVQSLMAVVLGAGLFIGFDQLWRWNNLVALILSVLVVLTLAAAVRFVRKTEDIVSTLTAVAVGLLVTLGPLALQST